MQRNASPLMQQKARDAVKLALPGFRHSVDWWGLPTRLEWALAPDRGALGYQTGSLAARMAFGRLRGPWVQELKSSGGVMYSVQRTLPEADGRRGRCRTAVSWGWLPWGPLRCDGASVGGWSSVAHAVRCRRMGIHAGWLGTALQGVSPTLRVGTLASFVRQKKNWWGCTTFCRCAGKQN